MDRVTGVQTVPEAAHAEGFLTECGVAEPRQQDAGLPFVCRVFEVITCDHIRNLPCVAPCLPQEGYQTEEPTGDVMKKNRGKD